MDQSYDKLSQQDQHFVDSYRKIHDAQGSSKKAVEDAAQKVADAKEYQKRSASTLDAIKDKLYKLGLQ